MNIYQIIILLILIVTANIFWNSNLKTASSTNILTKSTLKEQSNEKNDNTLKYFYTGIALFALLGGLWGINHWFNDYNTAIDSKNWPTYNGTMLEKSIGSNSLNTTESQQRSGRTFCPKVKYKFNYKGKTIIWNRIDYLNRVCSGDTTISKKILINLPEAGDPVTVYFSAEKKRAVLIPGSTGTSYSGLIINSIFLILGLVGIKLIYQ